MTEFGLESINDLQNQPRSCDQCRQRKIKCDFTKPRCQTCVRREKTCSYDDPIRKRGPKPRQISDADYLLSDGQYSKHRSSNGASIPINISFAHDPFRKNSFDYFGCSHGSFSQGDFTPGNYTPNGFSSQNHTPGGFSSVGHTPSGFHSISHTPGGFHSVGHTPGGFSSLSHTPGASMLNLLSPETSPSGSLHRAFSNFSIHSNGLNVSDAYGQVSYSPMNHTPGNSFHTPGNSFLQSNLSEMLSAGHLSPATCTSYPTLSAPTSQFSTRPQSPSVCSPVPDSSGDGFNELTELEVSLMDLYYKVIHPTFLLIPKEITSDLTHLQTDYTLQFLIYSMCAAAASVAQSPLLSEHAPEFLSHAQKIANYVSDQNTETFSWGIDLLRLYFPDSFYTCLPQ